MTDQQEHRELFEALEGLVNAVGALGALPSTELASAVRKARTTLYRYHVNHLPFS